MQVGGGWDSLWLILHIEYHLQPALLASRSISMIRVPATVISPVANLLSARALAFWAVLDHSREPACSQSDWSPTSVLAWPAYTPVLACLLRIAISALVIQILFFVGQCSGRPARADWQTLVRPALLLMSLHKQLLEGLALQQTEADALKPLDWPFVMQGLVALQQKLTE